MRQCQPKALPRRLMRECIIAQPAAFVRSNAFRRIGMLDPEEKVAFDYDLWIRMAKSCHFEYVSEYWANSGMHRSAISFIDRKRVLTANMRLLERHYAYIPLQWIYGYCCYLLDARDQFFEPLRHSILGYTMSLVYGLLRNYRHPGRFMREWISAPLKWSVVRHYWRSSE